MPTEGDLLQAWRDGDSRAGETLFANHFRALYRFFASKLEHRAEDLTQRTFLACVEGRLRMREDSSFRAYLFGIARNVLLEEVRKRGVAGRGNDLMKVTSATISDSPSRFMAVKQEQKLLAIAMRSIPIDHQIAIELYYWEEMPIKEIAMALDMPEGTVKTRLYQARQLLKDAMQEMTVPEELLRATLDDLEGWARSLRDAFGREKDDD